MTRERYVDRTPDVDTLERLRWQPVGVRGHLSGAAVDAQHCTGAPVLGDLLARVVKPNATMLVRLMSSMGEKDTIVRYPDLIEALVAAGNDPIASAVNLAELRAAISSFGFRRSMRCTRMSCGG